MESQSAYTEEARQLRQRLDEERETMPSTRKRQHEGFVAAKKHRPLPVSNSSQSKLQGDAVTQGIVAEMTPMIPQLVEAKLNEKENDDESRSPHDDIVQNVLAEIKPMVQKCLEAKLTENHLEHLVQKAREVFGSHSPQSVDKLNRVEEYLERFHEKGDRLPSICVEYAYYPDILFIPSGEYGALASIILNHSCKMVELLTTSRTADNLKKLGAFEKEGTSAWLAKPHV